MAPAKIQPKVTTVDTASEMPRAQPIQRTGGATQSAHPMRLVLDKKSGKQMMMVEKAALNAVKREPNNYQIIR